MNQLDRIDYPIKELPTGDKFELSLFRITGSSPGPHVHIQASVHGAELQGNAVIHQIMDRLLHHDFNGTVTLIPTANPQATNLKMGQNTFGRFNSVTGHNWNRNYTDLMSIPQDISGFNLNSFLDENAELPWVELKGLYKKAILDMTQNCWDHFSQRGMSENKKLNLLLQKLAAPADIVLDLHTGPIATRYLYSAEYQKESAKYFLFPHTLIIPNEFAGAMDEATFVPWVQFHNALEERGIYHPREFESYTVELGSEEKISMIEAHEDAKRVLNYLHFKGVIPEHSGIFPGDQFYCGLDDYKTYYSPSGGLVDYLRGPGERFNSGDTLFKILNFKGLQTAEDFEGCLKEINALNDGIVINHNTSSALGEGQEVYQVMENYQLY